MTRRLVTGAWLIAALLAGAIGAPAQVQSVDTSQPIVIKSSKPVNPKHLKFLGTFVSATPEAVTVRDLNNTYLLAYVLLLARGPRQDAANRRARRISLRRQDRD